MEELNVEGGESSMTMAIRANDNGIAKAIQNSENYEK